MDDRTRFPLREICNPNDPEEAFVWMLVAMPSQNGAPLIMPVEYLRMISQRLWDCGARPVADPIIKYRLPTGREPHWMVAPGTWVPISEPDPVRPTAADAWNLLTPEQQAEIAALFNPGIES